MALGLALPALILAQDNNNRPARPANGQAREAGPGVGGPQGDGPRRPTPPLMEALDANHDGVIDEEEIKNASAARRKLDKNGDGKITQDELRPARPDGPRGPGQGPRPPQE